MFVRMIIQLLVGCMPLTRRKPIVLVLYGLVTRLMIARAFHNMVSTAYTN